MFPSPFVNIIVGRNMSGKSAAMRALRLVFFNKPEGSDFVRWGTDNAIVEIEYDDHVIQRIKGKENVYILDGSKFANFGKSIPLEISDALGFSPIIIERENIELNFDNPHSPPFLVSETDTMKGRILSSLGEAVVQNLMLFDKAISTANNRVRDRSKECTLLTERVDSTTLELEKYVELDDVLQEVENCHQLLNELETTSNSITKLAAMSVNFQAICNNIVYYEALATVSLDIDKVNDKLLRMQELRTEINSYKLIAQALNQYTPNIERLEECIKVSVGIPNMQEIYFVSNKLVELNTIKKQLSSIDLHVTTLSEHISGIEGSLDTLINTSSMITTLQEDLSPLYNVKIQLHTIGSLIQSANTNISLLDNELRNDILVYVELLRDAKTCPVCKQPINSHTLEAIVEELTNNVK